MSTFVLVHGGGHGGWCYKKLITRLRGDGHLVYAPSLTGLADRRHLVSDSVNLDTHITDIVSLLDYEDLRDVILVGHSYGGMVITGVADRAAGRIARLVYLDAANPVNGQSLVDVAGPIMAHVRTGARMEDGVELVMWPTPDAGRLYGVTDPDDLAWMQERLTPHPWKCFEQPLNLTNEEAVWAIPQTHIICASTLPGRDQAWIGARSDGPLHQIDTGHDLMITEPDRVAALLVAPTPSPGSS
jgi:pimeloyl-ACP methyl ester carboxylesterase